MNLIVWILGFIIVVLVAILIDKCSLLCITKAERDELKSKYYHALFENRGGRK